MELNNKKYKLEKTQNLLKNNSFILFFHGTKKNSQEFKIMNQKLKSINLISYSNSNKITKKLLEKSIFISNSTIIHGNIFFIKPNFKNKIILWKHISNSLESLLFLLLAVKLNNIVYSAIQIKKINSFEYKENKLLLYQFIITNLKLNFKKSK